jgi:hypothetical protein
MFTGTATAVRPNPLDIAENLRRNVAPLPDVPAGTSADCHPPEGGSLSAGIQCGTLGSDCSATHEQKQVTLYARADEVSPSGLHGNARGQLLIAPRARRRDVRLPAVLDAARSAPRSRQPGSGAAAIRRRAGRRESGSPENFTSSAPPPSRPARVPLPAAALEQRPASPVRRLCRHPDLPEVVVSSQRRRLLKTLPAYEQLTRTCECFLRASRGSDQLVAVHKTGAY